MQMKVLVVDDSASDRLLIKKMLSGHCVLTACDGMEAMRILEAHDGIDLLILDLHMPNMDGFKVLESLKGNERYNKLITIILAEALDDEINGLKLGAADYIRKPIRVDLLKARIDVHIALLCAQHAYKHQRDEQTLIFDMIFEQAPIGIAITRRRGPERADRDVIRVNSEYEKITGRTKDELMRLGWEEITHPDDMEEDKKNYRKLVSGEIQIYTMDKRYIKPDGSVVWVHMIVAPLILSDDQPYGHITLVQDITERKTIEKALAESERSKSVFLSHLPGLAYRCNNDEEWTMQYVSAGCFNLTGYHPEALLYNRDLSYNDIIVPEYREALIREWARTLPIRQPFKHEYEIMTATGERKWVLEMGQGIYDDDGEVESLEGIVIDISDRKAVENTLKYNSEHDKWTGLYNRDYLVALLEKDIRLKRGIKKALIGINLSMVQLLAINYGYQYTQNLMKKVAEALSLHCTEHRLLFHARENRFVFYLLDYKDKNELVDFSRAIISTLESLLITERIGGGIGILEIEPSQDEVDINILLRRLLIASERTLSVFGRDFQIYFYNQELEALVNRERDIVEALNMIAAGDDTNNALFLQYQPLMILQTGSICGFEALARLKTEKLGLVSPLEFIPLAEKTKLIFPIGEKVIIKAFRFLNKLRKCGYDGIDVAINISVIQLLNPDFTSRLFELIEDMQVNPTNIIIEITESVFASDYDSINKTIGKLRDAGLRIAIDDFGTGYSSLARENELTVDCIKIDKRFIDKLIDADPNLAITSDIISMSHKLGHCTIAEGVEHESQLQYLKKHACDKIQGYLVSKPLDEKEALEFLERHHA